jgi:hypothetical protein
MSDRKLTKGNHYSCQHQELGKSICKTCSSGGGGVEAKTLPCSKCKKKLGNIIKTSFNTGTETHYKVEEDCYQDDKKLHTCVGCYEKGKDNNQERERERERANSNSDCWIRGYN